MKETIHFFEDNNLYMGRMISGSKSGYINAHRDHDVVFNANVFVEGLGKVWYGDLDITLDAGKLQNISNEMGKKLLVLREMMGRFERENISFEEAMQDAHTLFKPSNDVYYIRIYDGLKNVKSGNMNIITSKGVSWKEIMFMVT